MYSIADIKATCKKSYEEHAAYRFNRMLSFYLTKPLLHLGVSANTVTVGGGIAALIGGILYMQSAYVWGSIFFYLFLLGDDIDGNIARYTGKTSLFGRWLDILIGHVVYPYFFSTLGVGLFLSTGDIWFLVFGFLSAVVKLIERSIPGAPKQDEEDRAGAKDYAYTHTSVVASLKEWSAYVYKFCILFPFVLLFALFAAMDMYLYLVTAYGVFYVSLKIFYHGYRLYKTSSNVDAMKKLMPVILAAGRGQRLKPLSDELPKCMAPIEDKPLIAYSLDNLQKAGFTRVVIVVGYKANLIKEWLGNSYKGMELIYRENKAYETGGSLKSLLSARDVLTEDLLIFDADILYDYRGLQEVIESPHTNCMLVSTPFSNTNDEVYTCQNDKGELIALGKDVTLRDTACGEMVGICRLSQAFFTAYCARYADGSDKTMEDCHYEDAIAKLSLDVPVMCAVVKDLIWTEIDNARDYQRAKEQVFPALQKQTAVQEI